MNNTLAAAIFVIAALYLAYKFIRRKPGTGTGPTNGEGVENPGTARCACGLWTAAECAERRACFAEKAE
ncbi:hypothetical protein AZ78_1311 [Lysobacter capsici AZ78]|uniref:Uncharacterized protein n=1 Tax=Lysobacter capsici AZ78 TaxID=1444315 RepID=A0A108U730_9GAMM|nr:hypothetical protein [Lysobacter capsici]KWS03762.1 hypothetical protein AZ78_1311 [Lysobacter capsici AZ78]